ncbi:Inner centromere protein [Carabus blaptoides fortunei]
MTSSNDFIAEIFTRMSQKTALCMISFKESCQEHFDWLENFHKEVLASSLESEDDCDRPLLPKTPVPKSKKRPAAVSSSEDEAHHISRQITDNEISLNSTGKPRRNASKMASAKINVQTHMKLNTKMRRPGSSDKENVQKDVAITKKDLVLPTEQTQVLNDATNDMPPPMFKPKRGRKKIKSEIEESAESETETVRTTRSKRAMKKEKDDKPVEIKVPTAIICPDKPKRNTRTRARPDSDVVIQEVPVTVITISDNDEEPTETAGYASSVLSEAESNIADTKITDTEDDEPVKKVKGKKKTKKPTKTASKKEMINKEKSSNEIAEKSIDLAAEKDQPNRNNEPEETDKIVEKSAQDNEKIASNMNCTVTLQKNIDETYTSAFNSTQVLQKEISSLLSAKETASFNTTQIIEKARNSPAIDKLLKESGINFNCTVVLDKINATVTLNDCKKTDNQVVNKTMILSPKETNTGHWQKKDNVLLPSSALDNLLTDDDDSIVMSNKKQTPVKKAETKKAAKTKPMFSPYANSPVKKRVAAFEQLGTGAIDMPTRVTRTKTKMLTEKENELKGITEETGNRTKSKYITPIMSKKIPSMVPYTDGKQYRTQTFAANKMYNTSTMSSDVSVKSATAVKPTKAELIERKAEEQRRRLEKEDDVKRKKEALLQAKIEEQKRRREEKQAKAQKAREQIDREKEEKFRQMLQEKEEKQLEEQQRKREWATKKAAEMEERRKIEEQIKLAKMREYEVKKKQEDLRKPKYGMKPPPLPTEDCEDSDSSSENVKPRVPGPSWGQKKQLVPHLLMMRHVPRQFIETFFQMQPTTPDLRQIFESVDERTLRRNSSAVWRTPPRYSTLPKF